MTDALLAYLKERTGESDEVVELMAGLFSQKSVKKNCYLLQREEISQHYYFVDKGCLRIFTTNKEGIENTRYFAFENAMGTALPSFIDQTPSIEYVQAIEDSELSVISRSDFYKLVDSNPGFARLYRFILERGFITAQQRIYGFQGDSAIDKLRWTLRYRPDFLQRVSNGMAASYLGIAPETLSRLKLKL
jgi:CRP-like cAMP-binding protein